MGNPARKPMIEASCKTNQKRKRVGWSASGRMMKQSEITGSMAASVKLREIHSVMIVLRIAAGYEPKVLLW